MLVFHTGLYKYIEMFLYVYKLLFSFVDLYVKYQNLKLLHTYELCQMKKGFQNMQTTFNHLYLKMVCPDCYFLHTLKHFFDTSILCI